jgi:hypothetical protein
VGPLTVAECSVTARIAIIQNLYERMRGRFMVQQIAESDSGLGRVSGSLVRRLRGSAFDKFTKACLGVLNLKFEIGAAGNVAREQSVM